MKLAITWVAFNDTNDIPVRSAATVRGAVMAARRMVESSLVHGHGKIKVFVSGELVRMDEKTTRTKGKWKTIVNYV